MLLFDQRLRGIGFTDRYHMKPNGVQIFYRLKWAKTLEAFLLILRVIVRALFNARPIQRLNDGKRRVIPERSSQIVCPDADCLGRIYQSIIHMLMDNASLLWD